MPEPTFKYAILICWDEEQQAHIADVPDLPTTCTGSGSAYAEALEWWQERTHRTRRTLPSQAPDP